MSTLKVNNIQSVTDGSVNFPQGSISSQPVTFPDGTASNPSISFTGDTDTGLYRIGSNTIGISSGGTERARIDNNGLEVIDGTASNPSLSFLNDSDTGLYRIDANKIGIATNGSRVGEIGVGYGGFTGNVIQVQSVTYPTGTQFTTTNTTPQPTGHKITFSTKYANSRILFLLSACNGNSSAGNWSYVKIRNNTDSVDVGGSFNGSYVASSAAYMNQFYQAYYSVNNTNSKEYEIYLFTNAGGSTAVYNTNGYFPILTLLEVQQ